MKFRVELGCSAAPTKPPGPSGLQTQWVQRFADEMCHLVARQRVIVNLKTKKNIKPMDFLMHFYTAGKTDGG